MLRLCLLGILSIVFYVSAADAHETDQWPNRSDWAKTDFSQHLHPAKEFLPGGPRRDGIQSIDHPKFKPATEIQMAGREPVVALKINEVARAYPLSILMWHEIVNDTIEGQRISVTYCPLCNAAIVYDRKVGGRYTTFGVSGLLRNSDMIMYDRTTHSWWQQYTGKGIVGERTGVQLTRIPAQLISYAQFRKAFPEGEVLVPNDPGARDYGRNPYIDHDRTGGPFPVHAKPPKGFKKMERVVVVGNEAWRMTSIAKAGQIEHGALRLTWTAGQASALDRSRISEGKDVGNVLVHRKTDAGDWELENYDVIYAFVFAAFNPDGVWHP